MIVVETMFFNNNNYSVETEIIPCENKKTARALVKTIYEKILEESFNFDSKKERKEWELSNVEKEKNGNIRIDTMEGDGYIYIKIIDKKTITYCEVSSYKPMIDFTL